MKRILKKVFFVVCIVPAVIAALLIGGFAAVAFFGALWTVIEIAFDLYTGMPPIFQAIPVLYVMVAASSGEPTSMTSRRGD